MTTIRGIMYLFAFSFINRMSDAMMTTSFPLGKCKMGSPSLPYMFQCNQHSRPHAGWICLDIILNSNWEKLCNTIRKYNECAYMLENVQKIAFWYSQTYDCGNELTVAYRSQSQFVWKSSNGLPAAHYKIYAPNSTTPHATGLLNLFKVENAPDNIISSSVQVVINNGKNIKRDQDPSLNNYSLCIEYNPNIIKVDQCITEKNILKYSFYDAAIHSLCTVGNLDMKCPMPLPSASRAVNMQ